jgi:outer membrane protein OmpA-like peptidoglycan-associated protein
MGVFKINNFGGQAKTYSGQSKANALDISRKNEAFVVLNQKELVNLETGEKTSLSDPTFNTTDLAYNENKIWVGGNNGLFVFNSKTLKQTDHYTTENSRLKSNQINFIYSDSQNILWIGTNAGVVRIKDGNWKLYEKDLKMLAIYENIEGVWLVSENEVWVIDLNNRWYPAGYHELIKGNVRDITIDQKGKIYIASEVLTRFDPYTNETKMYTEELGLLSKQCLSLLCDKNNQIWIGTENAGLFKIGFQDTAIEDLSVAAIVQTELNCHGDNTARIKVNVSGGERPYRYKWENRALFGNNPGGLKAGSYQLTVTDKLGNEFVNAVEITEPPAIKAVIVEAKRVSSQDKKDGEATINVTGGHPPYSIIWPNKASGSSAKRLSAGSHKVKIIDSLGCVAVAQVDIQKAKFIPELNVANLNVGQTLRINELFFEADSSIITDISYPVLDEIFQFLLENPTVVIEIGGHTNNIPPHEYCDKLSTSRARNVAEYLYSRGITGNRIASKGYGKRNPIATNLTFDGRKKNQRVEIKIISVN